MSCMVVLELTLFDKCVMHLIGQFESQCILVWYCLPLIGQLKGDLSFHWSILVYSACYPIEFGSFCVYSPLGTAAAMFYAQHGLQSPPQQPYPNHVPQGYPTPGVTPDFQGYPSPYHQQQTPGYGGGAPHGQQHGIPGGYSNGQVYPGMFNTDSF